MNNKILNEKEKIYSEFGEQVIKIILEIWKTEMLVPQFEFVDLMVMYRWAQPYTNEWNKKLPWNKMTMIVNKYSGLKVGGAYSWYTARVEGPPMTAQETKVKIS
ncbi:Hypothetical protein CINCED_3A020771 [Cinara cedri]|uniref:Uncharacterized protein n=1 Tax=Cinara cedri TaxID=506608 RepID=A0A5E4N5R6_9HEMI|nr:Hypothetical protein CINCED_3A020771 [Cinara cedri]